MVCSDVADKLSGLEIPDINFSTASSGEEECAVQCYAQDWMTFFPAIVKHSKFMYSACTFKLPKLDGVIVAPSRQAELVRMELHDTDTVEVAGDGGKQGDEHLVAQK